MKQTLKTIALIAAVSGLTTAMQAQVTVYENNYDSQTSGATFNEGGPWNWLDGGIGTHTVTYQDIGGGNIVVDHSGAIDNTGTSAVNTRFGTQWGLAVSGNTSLNPADYTISFDIRNVSGPWDPYDFELWVVPGGQGHGIGFSAAQADGWVHVSESLDQLNLNWWNGTSWDLTNPTWTIEVGGPPYPGVSVDPGVSFTQEWQMDNLKITMVPEPTTLAMLAGGLGLLVAGWRRKRGIG